MGRKIIDLSVAIDIRYPLFYPDNHRLFVFNNIKTGRSTMPARDIGKINFVEFNAPVNTLMHARLFPENGMPLPASPPGGLTPAFGSRTRA